MQIDDIRFEKEVLSWLEEVLILVVDAMVIDLEDLIRKKHRQKKRI